MRKFIFSLLFLLFGCSDPGDQASANLKKGDEFFAKNEYEVAEYYYDKIPEDSPFFRQAQKKLNIIASAKTKWKVVQGDTVDISQVVLIENEYQTSNVSRLPIHSITLENKSWKRLESVNIEFTYFKETGTVIAKLIGSIETNLEPRTQRVFKNISPGTIQEQFVKCDARIVSANFQ